MHRETGYTGAAKAILERVTVAQSTKHIMKFVEQTVRPGGRILEHRFLCWLLHGWRHWRIEQAISPIGENDLLYECVKCNWRWMKWEDRKRERVYGRDF